MEPQGQLKVVETKMIPKPNSVVVFWETVFEDENQDHYSIIRSCFKIELKVTEKNEKGES